MLREREEGERDEGWEEETPIGCLPFMPQQRIKLATQICTLTRNHTSNLLVHRTLNQPMIHSGQAMIFLNDRKRKTLPLQ